MALRIPKNLKYFMRGAVTQSDLCGIDIIVRSTFSADADSATRCETGKRWAGNNNTETIERLNEPFRGLYIISLEQRGEGGRAYKVAIKNPNAPTSIYWEFDLREPVLLDIMANIGIQAGGYVDADFVWIIDSSQMRITRVGSPEYHKALSYSETIPVEFKDLEFGKTYVDATDTKHLFLGWFKAPILDINTYWDKLNKAKKLLLFPEVKRFKKVGLFLEKPFYSTRYKPTFKSTGKLRLTTNDPIECEFSTPVEAAKAVIKIAVDNGFKYPYYDLGLTQQLFNSKEVQADVN